DGHGAPFELDGADDVGYSARRGSEVKRTRTTAAVRPRRGPRPGDGRLLAPRIRGVLAGGARGGHGRQPLHALQLVRRQARPLPGRPLAVHAAARRADARPARGRRRGPGRPARVPGALRRAARGAGRSRRLPDGQHDDRAGGQRPRGGLAGRRLSRALARRPASRAAARGATRRDPRGRAGGQGRCPPCAGPRHQRHRALRCPRRPGARDARRRARPARRLAGAGPPL
ncbi:MAG: hypothetical protein AVDCRST_MAG13-254, partial [uncultured Solirubrobacteraceae bacterium]